MRWVYGAGATALAGALAVLPGLQRSPRVVGASRPVSLAQTLVAAHVPPSLLDCTGPEPNLVQAMTASPVLRQDLLDLPDGGSIGYLPGTAPDNRCDWWVHFSAPPPSALWTGLMAAHVGGMGYTDNGAPSPPRPTVFRNYDGEAYNYDGPAVGGPRFVPPPPPHSSHPSGHA